MLSFIWAFIIFNLLLLGSKADFKIYWNVPSSPCSRNYGINVTHDLLKKDILVNNEEKFNGDKIVIFYESQLGKYPYIDINNGVDVNGGIPQLANLTKHLMQAKLDIEKWIPDPNFNGLGVIDWESWRPIFSFNWGNMQIYKDRTVELVKRQYPYLSDELTKSFAEKQWEETAKKWMLKTLELAKEMRPKAKWCYYLFPDCYNYNGKDQPSQYFCSEGLQTANDRLSWLWEESTALCPSIYHHSSQMKYNDSQYLWYLYGRLSEARRVSSPTTLIYPYVTYKIPGTQSDVPEGRFWLMLSLSASMGLDGIVIWGSSNYVGKRKQCEDLESYVKRVIGPSASTISMNFNTCSETICNGVGRCIWPEEPYTSWRYLANQNKTEFEPGIITCRCQNKEGRYCNLSTFMQHFCRMYGCLEK